MGDTGTRVDPPEAGAANGYEITATSSLPDMRLRTLKHGRTFALFDPHGDITPVPGRPDGLFHDDTRFLSGLRLLFSGYSPLLLSSTVQDDNVSLAVNLTNPDVFHGDTLVLAKDLIHILRTTFVWHGRCYERLRIQNFNDRQHSFSISLYFEADFADLFEIRGHRRPRRGTIDAALVGDTIALFGYTALDGRRQSMSLVFEPVPDQLETTSARYDLTLGPGELTSLFVTCTCADEAGPAKSTQTPGSTNFLTCFREARRSQRLASARAASVETSNDIFNEVLRRSRADLYMLMTDTDYGPYPFAGVPWFSTVFGRDGIITAMQTLWLDPDIARGVLLYLASNQATQLDPHADAEPGKILHEMRMGEMARLNEVPFRHYYGSVDSTPLFIMLAGLYYERTHDEAAIRHLWPHIEAALDWIDTYGDVDGDGLVDYSRKEAAGLLNQGWKDSHDSVFHEDGRTAVLPIALCEVQGYVYAAKRHAARLARALGHDTRAATLDGQADQLRHEVETRFWMEDKGFYALALDGHKQPCRVLASNAGHLLFCGLPSEARAARVAELLCGNAFFSGWGVRTLAKGEPRYNPISYHNGSVWPHDNALIALGLAGYGLSAHARLLFQGLFDTASYMDLRRLPELYCGFRRQPGTGPTTYPVACAPQAWASGSTFALLQACLGIRFAADRNEIRFERPWLPRFLDELVLRSLRLGDHRADILLRRYGDDVSVNVLSRSGDVTVAVTY